MDIIQIVFFGLVAAILAVILRQYNRELALLLSLAAGVLIFLQLLEPLIEVLRVVEELTLEGHLDRM